MRYNQSIYISFIILSVFIPFWQPIPFNLTLREKEFRSTECLVGLYMPILFSKGYGFSNDTNQIQAQDKINNKSIGTAGHYVKLSYIVQRWFVEYKSY